MNLGELVVQLGVKADTMTVKDFAKAIGDIPASVATSLLSLAGLSYGFVEMTKRVLDMTSGFQVFTAETGLNAKALQQWQSVAKEAGLSGDVVTGALTSLANLMGGMRTGHINHGAMVALGQLGIGSGFMNMSPYELLNQIQQKALLKNPMEATSLLSALGIAPEMMRLFQTPQSARERIAPEMSSSDVAQMAEFQKSLAEFNRVAMHEFVKVLVEFEPYMKGLTDVLVDLIRMIGPAAKPLLEDVIKVDKLHRQGKLFDTLIHGDGSSAMAPVLIYQGGDATYNVNGLSDTERTARWAVEAQMRKEMLERQHAASTFGQSGT